MESGRKFGILNGLRLKFGILGKYSYFSFVKSSKNLSFEGKWSYRPHRKKYSKNFQGRNDESREIAELFGEIGGRAVASANRVTE